jgi:SAM-dependent methyltransferase
MRDQDLGLLCCLECQGELSLNDAQRNANGTIESGLLRCLSCDQCYAVLRGVLLAFRRDVLGSYLSAEEKASIINMGYEKALVGLGLVDKNEQAQVDVSENWEFQWNEVMVYDRDRLEGDGLYSAKALSAFIPIPPEDLAGSCVFVGCGGRGREAYHIHKLGAGRVIINELGREIYGIPKATGLPPEDLLLIRGDVRYLPLKDGSVDIAICDHALQHVIDHNGGFSSMSRIARAGGLVSVCVYSWENNFLMTHLVEPMKPLLHKIPLKLLLYLSILPGILLYLLIHGVYVPASKLAPVALSKRLPLFDHFMFWSKFTFRDLWGAMFDLLHAPVSYHFRKSELLDMAKRNALSVRTLVNTHKTLWSFVGQRLG